MQQVIDAINRLDKHIVALTVELQLYNTVPNKSSHDPRVTDYFDGESLLKLPKHLQRTMLSLLKLGRATAQQVADASCIKRPIESSYLNILETMGYVKSEKEGRIKFFKVNLIEE